MEKITQKRALAAIMFTDIVGYTALMGKDSQKALELVHLSKEIQKPLVEKHGGKWLKEMGDGAMAQFSTALDAVNCAVEIQKAAQVEFDGKLRIGIHSGDITIEDHDVYGDGVNVASRLESVADPGGIYISDAILKAIQGQTNIQACYLGDVKLKNVAYRVRTYAIQGDGLPEPTSKLALKRQALTTTGWLAIIATILVVSIATYFFTQNNKVIEDNNGIKTVAVLPFQNVSNDSETAYFVDGIMKVILDNLAEIGDLEVTAGKAVEPYADGYPSAKEVGEALNVDYLIETSVRKVDNKIQVMVQLVDTRNERQIWDETYDREWKDVLKLQSDLSLNIAQNLNTTLTDPEIKMIRATDNVDPVAQDYLFKAWDFYQRGGIYDKQNIDWAIEMTKKAIAIDSGYVRSWITLKNLETMHYFYGGDRSNKQKLKIKNAYAKALLLKPESRVIKYHHAYYLYSIEKDYPPALEIFEQLASQYPQIPSYKNSVALTYRRLGNFRKSAQIFSELIKSDPTSAVYHYNYGQTQTILRNYREAALAFNKIIEMAPDFTSAYQLLAKVQIDIDGNTERARQTLNETFLLEEFWADLSWFELYDRNFRKAIELWESAADEGLIDQQEFKPKSLGLALIYHMMENDSSQVLFRESLDILLAKIEETPNDWRLYASLGLAYAGLGEKQKAIESVARLEEIMISLNDALNTRYIEQEMIRIYIINKEYDLAIDLIKKHLDEDSLLTIIDLKLDPIYDPLRELPEFQAILANPKYQINLEEE